jgi:RNA polymerase subunit RPABC4/transcription elongation factor Spt4
VGEITMAMNFDEIKTKIGEIADEITDLERAELLSCAELGRKLLLDLGDNPEYAAFVEKIKGIYAKLSRLRDEQSALDIEYQQKLEAVTCYYCKTVNLEGAAFCEECGSKLGKPREYCDSCKTMNRPEQKFCGECGAKLDDPE